MSIKVKRRDNESLARVLKRLKKMLEKEGLRRDMMRHRYYESECVRRRRERWKNASKTRRQT